MLMTDELDWEWDFGVTKSHLASLEGCATA